MRVELFPGEKPEITRMIRKRRIGMGRLTDGMFPVWRAGMTATDETYDAITGTGQWRLLSRGTQGIMPDRMAA